MDNYTKISILENSLFIFISKFIDTFGGILSVIILARFLDTAGFGIYAYILSIFLALQPVVNLELDKITIRELATSLDKSRFMKDVRTLKSLMLVVFFTLFTFGIIFTKQPANIRAGLFLCLISEIFIQYNMLNVSFLIVFQKAVWDSYANAFSKFFFLAWIIVGWLLHKDIVYVFAGYLISNFIRFALLTLLIRLKIYKTGMNWAPGKFLYLLRESLPITIASFIIGLTFRIDIFVLKYYLGDTPVGLFYSIHKIILVIQIIPVSLLNAFFPHLSYTARENSGEYMNMYKKVFELLFLTATAVILFNLLFSREIISILYGKGYEDAHTGFMLLIPVSLFLFLDYLNTLSLTSLNRQKFLLYSGIAAFVTNTALDMILVPRMGMEGACIGTFAAYLVLCSVSFLCHPRHIIQGISYRESIISILSLVSLFYISTMLVGYFPRVLIMLIYILIIYHVYGLSEKIRFLMSMYRERK